MKVFYKLFVVFIVITSCSSNQKEYTENLAVIAKINDKVAFENSCKLTSNYSSLALNEIELKIGNSYSNPLYPGKILFDYYRMVESTDLDIKEYHLNDSKENLYSLSKDDFLHLNQKSKLSESLLSGYKSKDLTKLYNQLDTIVKSKFTFQDFNDQLLKFDLKNIQFSGFQINDSLVEIGYGNSENRIMLVYKWNLDDNKIYGFSIE